MDSPKWNKNQTNPGAVEPTNGAICGLYGMAGTAADIDRYFSLKGLKLVPTS